MKYDIAHRNNKDLRLQQEADVKLIHDLNGLDNLKLTEKFTRGLIKTANENFKCYMPAYIAKEYQEGKVFIYNGLQAKNDGSGHTYHRVMWRKK